MSGPPVIRRAKDTPPIGYSDWNEAAQDAAENGELSVLDAREVPYLIVIPPEFLPVARAAAAKRKAGCFQKLPGGAS